MALTKVNLGGWSTGAKMTSAQANAFDDRIIKAADKTADGDTILGAWTMSGAGRIIPSRTVGANGNHTYVAGASTNSIHVTSAVTGSCDYTLSASGAQTNDEITVFCDPDFAYAVTIKDQGGAPIFTIGNPGNANVYADGAWATFKYIGGWQRMCFAPTRAAFQSEAFAANGTFTVPYGVTKLLLIGWGGGGGGGGGGNAGSTVDIWQSGGGGGGGALQSTVMVTVTPGDVIPVTVGPGGAGGAATVNGGYGSPTLFGGLAIFAGAQGGRNGGNANADTATYQMYTHGGSHVANYLGDVASPNYWFADSDAPAVLPPILPRGYGGPGLLSSNVNGSGNGAPNHAGANAAGGSGGTPGTDSGSYRGGGPGGGGGAGPGGPGGAGGNGGNANGSGVGAVGGAGTAAPSANSGAGGGGGGSAGNGTSGTPAGGAAAAAAAGHLLVSWVK